MLKVLRAVVIVFILTSCGGGGGVVTLVLDPQTSNLLVGETARFTATVIGTANVSVTWEATGGELLSKGGGATFVATQSGTFEVTVTSQARPDLIAVATVQVAPRPGKAHVRFVSDGSLVLAGEGETASLAVQVIASDGTIVEGGQVTWSSSDPAVATVAAAGDRGATVTTETSDTSQAQITATYDDLSATASVLITKPSAGTVLLDSSDVLAKAGDELTLRRTPTTELLTAGQRLATGSRAGVLVEVAGVVVGTEEVTVTTLPTSLDEAFDEFSFSGEVAPLEVTVQMVDGDHAIVTWPEKHGADLEATVLDDVTCTAGGSAAPVDLTGSEITLSASIYGEFAFSVFLGDDHFLSRFGATVQASASSGSVSLTGPVNGATCSLELPRIGLEPLSAGVITLWTGFVPILGVEVSASGAASSFSLGGPHGGLGAKLEAGIEYTDGSGWTPLLHADFNGDFAPFAASAAVDGPLSVSIAPFGQVDVGLSLDLGVDDLAVPLIDARFVELQGLGYLDLVVPSPADPAHPGFTGPEWTLGVGARGALKAEFQGVLPDLLEFIGIDVNFAGEYELFDERVELLDEPSLTFLATPAAVEIPEGGTAPVTLSAFTSGDEDGTVSFWASKDGASGLTFLTSAPLEAGEATTTWHVQEEGEYQLYSRVSTDDFSLVVPYAASNTASVSATAEDEEPEDRGPLGNEGPWRGYYDHFSLGACYGTGYAMTIDLFEEPDGSLTGTYVGHYCAADCHDQGEYPTGPIAGTLSGQRSGESVTFTLSAPVGGVFEGERFVPTAPPGSASLPVIDGFAEGVSPCEDEYGSINSGFFTFVGTESIWF
ncbi:MAG TPA: hypothetical protein VFF10_10700 [Trueperaceae bacterium]|nr:hypothetical protein [Trueperaceae bacterium]